MSFEERFTFERIHNTKEQIFYANFPGKHQDAWGRSRIPGKGVDMYKCVGVRFAVLFHLS